MSNQKSPKSSLPFTSNDSALRIALVCGGPSTERGISLNSARSVMDHLAPLGFEIVPFYCDRARHFYRLSPAQLYSNTPSDFDFKLKQTAEPLTLDTFIEACRTTDLVFPAIHGAFGEDGDLQALLEGHQIPFVGSSSACCRLMFDKGRANNHLARHGFATLPHCLVYESDSPDTIEHKIDAFFKENYITKAVVKPSAGGSSLGVAVSSSVSDAVQKAQNIFTTLRGNSVLIEPFCEGQEFTILVLESFEGEAVALIPTEIALSGGDIFDFRHKYLPTCHVAYHCPPRFDDATVAAIQYAAESIFRFFGMRDFARLDGWLMKDGRVMFSDFNPISGMEQNSFLFHQSSRLGLTHGDVLQYIVGRAAARHKISCRCVPKTKDSNVRTVRVLFGGTTAERQVSLMSGTNVWLKLLHSQKVNPEPYILASDNKIWKLPYSYTLNHTVEEILLHVAEHASIVERLRHMVPTIRQRLRLPSLPDGFDNAPRFLTLSSFCEEARDENDFVFLALHGGAGEDGTIQALLDHYDIDYNGSGPESSWLCMDKSMTGAAICALHDPLLTAATKIVCQPNNDPCKLWSEATEQFGTDDLLIKPKADGCSAGVVRLRSEQDLKIYLSALIDKRDVLSAGAIDGLDQTIELPSHADYLLLEPFIITDIIRIDGDHLRHHSKTGWIELTAGVLEQSGHYYALTPSITVAEGAVLSLEEKFQGGTGVNLTPPPYSIVSQDQIALIKQKVEAASKALSIEGYARIDLFFNLKTNQTLIIEANTLPGLTASTVIYHQALAEIPPLTPQLFLEKLVDLGSHRHRNKEKYISAP